MERLTIAEHYAALLKEAMPPGASAAQLRESRRMFYMGCAVVHSIMRHTG